MSFLISLLAIFAMHSPVWAKNASLCTRALEEAQKNDITANFISYLSYLNENGLLKNADLETMLLESQKQSQIVLPFLGSVTSSELYIHVDSLKEYLAADPNPQRVIDWLKIKVNQIQQVRKEKSESSQTTADGHLKIGQFHRLEMTKPFPFSMMVDLQNRRTPKLPYAFEVMPTAVTVAMWIEVMGRAPKDCKNIGDQPVTNITWWSMLEFSNRLSKQKGLIKVYNFKHLNFVPGTTAEDGTLAVMDENSSPKINAPENDIHQATGYRLPSRQEQFFIIGNGEELGNLKAPVGIDEKRILDYEWFEENADGQMQPVANRRPYLIQGHDFYDLIGNVAEASTDSAHVHTHDTITSDTAHAFGGTYEYKKSRIERIESETLSQTKNIPFDGFGFRLVRSLPK